MGISDESSSDICNNASREREEARGGDEQAFAAAIAHRLSQ